MQNHTSGLPVGYNRIREIGEMVSGTISRERKVPQPQHISKIFGQDAVLPYYFMHALFHNLERGNGKLFSHPIRRDGKALQEHSFSAAFSPYFRYLDQVIPSYFFLTPRESKGNLVHDVPEEFGQTLLGALVCINTIRYALSREMGEDANDLTNKNAMLLDPLEARLEKMKPPAINHDTTYQAFSSLCKEVKTRRDDLDKQYERIVKALVTFRSYVDREVNYMPEPQKKHLLEIIHALVNRVEIHARSKKTLKTDDAKQLLRQQYEQAMDIMHYSRGHGTYEEIKSKLLLPDDHEFLIVLKNTLYRDHINDIARKVKSRAKGADGDDYLATAMEKLSDFSHTGKNLDVRITNARSIIFKGSILIDELSRLALDLTAQGHDSSRLIAGIKWSYKNLKLGMHAVHVFHLHRSIAETTQESDLSIATLMKDEILEDLETRIAAFHE